MPLNNNFCFYDIIKNSSSKDYLKVVAKDCPIASECSLYVKLLESCLANSSVDVLIIDNVTKSTESAKSSLVLYSGTCPQL